MNATEGLPLFAGAVKPKPLTQVDRLFIRLMQERGAGLSTVQMMVEMFIANYTGRLSDGSKQGHRYYSKAIGKKDGKETAQWVYHYEGFVGDRDALKPEVWDALRRWEAWRATWTGDEPWHPARG